MSLLCAIGLHRPATRVIHNEGRIYSRCKACNADLILVGRRWKLAPRGYKVVWRAPPAPEPPIPKEEGEQPAKRRRRERRTNRAGDLPTKLGGRDRRRTGDRRKGFGKRPDAEES